MIAIHFTCQTKIKQPDRVHFTHLCVHWMLQFWLQWGELDCKSGPKTYKTFTCNYAWLIGQTGKPTLLFFLKPKSGHTQCPDPQDPIILHPFTTRHWGTCYASFNIAIWKRRTFIQLQPLTSGMFACTHPNPKQELIFAYLVLSWLVFVQALPLVGVVQVEVNQAFVGHLALGFLSWAFQSHSPAYISPPASVVPQCSCSFWESCVHRHCTV